MWAQGVDVAGRFRGRGSAEATPPAAGRRLPLPTNPRSGGASGPLPAEPRLRGEPTAPRGEGWVGFGEGHNVNR
jgi:hypothetical protein